MKSAGPFVAALILALSLGACGKSNEHAQTARRDAVTSPSSAGVSDAAPLRCGETIDTVAQPSTQQQPILGAIALDTRHPLQVSNLRSSGAAGYFAKTALLVKVGQVAEVVVPQASLSHLTVSWGTPGAMTKSLQIPGCGNSGSAPRWLVFPGGFTVDKRGCFPLLVKAGGRTQTVSVGVGASCPSWALHRTPKRS